MSFHRTTVWSDGAGHSDWARWIELGEVIMTEKTAARTKDAYL
jgi:hypothetical protein